MYRQQPIYEYDMFYNISDHEKYKIWAQYYRSFYNQVFFSNVLVLCSVFAYMNNKSDSEIWS